MAQLLRKEEAFIVSQPARSEAARLKSVPLVQGQG